jgi:hypothetical protein
MSPTERSRLLELIDSVAAIARCIYEPIVHGLGAAGQIVKRAGMFTQPAQSDSTLTRTTPPIISARRKQHAPCRRIFDLGDL